MTQGFFQTRRDRIKVWWHKPPTRLERFSSALLGMWAFLLVGVLLGFAFVPDHSLSIDSLIYIACGSATGGAIFGIIFPKLTLCITFPFSVIGVGIGSN